MRKYAVVVVFIFLSILLTPGCFTRNEKGISAKLRIIDKNITPQKVIELEDALRTRARKWNISQPIFTEQGKDNIYVKLPGVTSVDEAKFFFKTAVLEFKTEDGKTILTGNSIQSARAKLDPNTNEPRVILKFDSKGTEIFGKITKQNIHKRISIYLDDKLLTNPVVDEPITTGEAVLSGGYNNMEEAQLDALLLCSGALPVKIKILEMRSAEGEKLI